MISSMQNDPDKNVLQSNFAEIDVMDFRWCIILHSTHNFAQYAIYENMLINK